MSHDAHVGPLPMPSYGLTGRVDGHPESVPSAGNGSLKSSRSLPSHRSRDESPSELPSVNSSSRYHKIDATQINYSNPYDEDIALAVRDCWTKFRCNPPMEGPPRIKTAELYLQGLAHTLADQETWECWSMSVDDLDSQLKPHVVTESFMGQTRDRLSGVTQMIIQKAFIAHQINSGPGPFEGFEVNVNAFDADDKKFSPYVILPPAHILDYFLRCYVCRIEHYYPSLCGSKLRPNDLLRFKNPWTLTLLLLLMVALGSMSNTKLGARYLTR